MLSPPTMNSKETRRGDEDPSSPKKKPKKTWGDRMKQKFGKFMYKVNHSGGAFGQYNKLDFKGCKKKVIKLMGGHMFDDPK